MDDDGATLPLEEVSIPPQDEVRTQVLSLGQDAGVSLPMSGRLPNLIVSKGFLRELGLGAIH